MVMYDTELLDVFYIAELQLPIKIIRHDACIGLCLFWYGEIGDGIAHRGAK